MAWKSIKLIMRGGQRSMRPLGLVNIITIQIEYFMWHHLIYLFIHSKWNGRSQKNRVSVDQKWSNGECNGCRGEESFTFGEYQRYFTRIHKLTKWFIKINDISLDHEKIVDILLKNGAQVNIIDKEHKTPLHLAIRHGKFREIC